MGLICARKQRKDAIGMRSERAEVPQAVDRIDAAPAGVLKSGFEREVVAVESAEQGNAVHAGVSRAGSELALLQMAPYW